MPALARLLPPGHAFADFFVHRPFAFSAGKNGEWGPRRVLAFVIRSRAKSAALVDLGEAKALRAASEAFLDLVSGGHRGEAVASKGPSPQERLRGLLWEPLARELAGTRRLFVSADRFVARLPLGAIRAGDRHYLAESCDFVYVQDAGTLAGLLREERPGPWVPASLLAVGGIDYARAAKASEAATPAIAETLRGGRLRHWPALPQTGPEAAAVVELFRKSAPRAVVALLTGADASEAALRVAMPKAEVLHLATHGFYERAGIGSLWLDALARARPRDALPDGIGKRGAEPAAAPRISALPSLLCGLVCAGANDERASDRGEGILSGAKIAALDLARCRLAVLSACETGLGLDLSGEGLVSLRRCFREAGARTVVSSLWKVGDAATRELMQRFYTGLLAEKKSPARALREAKLAMCRAEPERPERWAAFVLAGDWR